MAIDKRVCKNILLTGVPGVGKTTLVRKLVAAVKDRPATGFYTREIREQGIRKGFELVSLDNRRAMLAHVDIQSSYRVSKYGVDIGGFEEFLNSLDFFSPQAELIVIDEIGKMECFSNRFVNLVVELLDGKKPLLATIALRAGGIIAQIKQRQDIAVFEVTAGNRDEIMEPILRLLG